jgi:hypothetical protein
MEDSILTSTKKMLGMDADYTAFDHDIIVNINSVFSTLNQLGVGPEDGFMIEDASALWADYLPDHFRLSNIKSYMYLRVRLLFDPPATSFAINAFDEQRKELEVRILMEMERTNWTDPDPDPILDDIIDGGYA